MELDEGEDKEKWDTQLQAKASSMKVCAIKVEEPSLEREEESQKALEQELKVEVRWLRNRLRWRDSLKAPQS